MYTITNIATNRTKGCLSHNHITGESPDFFMPIEPWVAGVQLKLFEKMNLTSEQFEIHKDYIKKLVEARVIEIEQPTNQKPVIVLTESVDTTKEFVEVITQAAQEVKIEPPIQEEKVVAPEEEEIKVVVQQPKPKKGKK